MKWLLATEIVSALSKPTRPPALVAWLNKHADEAALSVVTLGELSYGVRTAGNEIARRSLEEWLRRLRRQFSDAVLGIDEGTIIEWKTLLAELKAKKPHHPLRGQPDRGRRPTARSDRRVHQGQALRPYGCQAAAIVEPRPVSPGLVPTKPTGAW